jgi:serine/threonine-protein kinase
VVDQNPGQGEMAAKGSKVSLSVSAGPDTVTVPDLSGFSEDEARANLAALDLTVGATKKVDGSDVEQGKVVSTSPAAGESVAVGSAITLNVSSGLVEVPNVVGKPRSDAASELSDLGFRIKTSYVVSRAPEDEVLKQSVKAGEKVDYGTQVELTVARPAPPTPTPTTTTQPPTSTTTTTTPPVTRTTTTAAQAPVTPATPPAP